MSTPLSSQLDLGFADWTSLTLRKRIDFGQQTFQRVRPFLGRMQAKLVEALIRTSEERDFFIGKMLELENLIDSTRFAHMPDCAETGYISLPEMLKAGAELDFHWTAKTLAEIASA